MLRLLNTWKSEILEEEREVVETFELKYSCVVPGTENSDSIWNIEDSLQPFPITPYPFLLSCIMTDPLLVDRVANRSLIVNCSKNFNRSSKAARRLLVER